MWAFVGSPKHVELLRAGWVEARRKPTYVDDWLALLVRNFKEDAMWGTSCPKCGVGRLGPPSYQRSAFRECLKYSCNTCGWSTTTPTKDQRDAKKALGGIPST
jgi:hypothetical protein